jgi:hypothetical protein
MKKTKKKPRDIRQDTCPCGICGDATPYTGTKRCNDCWEMEWRIGSRPHIGAKILAMALEEKRQEAIARDEYERRQA